MTLTTLVIGGHAAARESAIESAIAAALAAGADQHASIALILEGLSDGVARFDPEHHPSSLNIVRIAPGCLCCSGNLVMRVTLNRLLRRPPSRLYISLATTTHLDDIRQFLSQAPYDALLTLTDDFSI
jgi:hypothetical protein